MDSDVKRKRSSQDRDDSTKSTKYSSTSSPLRDSRRSKEREDRDRDRDRDRDHRDSRTSDRRDYRDDRDRDRDRRSGGDYRDDRDRDSRSSRRDYRDDRDRRNGDYRDDRDRRSTDYYDDRDRRSTDYRDDRDRRSGGEYRDERDSSRRDDRGRSDEQKRTSSSSSSTSPTTVSAPTKIALTISAPPVSAIDPEILKKQREEEKNKEQERLEEEMRKRREKVEQWRKEKEKELAAAYTNAQSTTNGTTISNTTTSATITATTVAPTGSTISMSSNGINSTKPKQWSLEEDDEDESKEKELPNMLLEDDEEMKDFKPPNSLNQDDSGNGQQQQNNQTVDEDEEDSLDAYMNQLISGTTKDGTSSASSAITKVKRLEDGDEAEFEEESDDENEKEKEVKKGKRELLSTDHSKIDYVEFEKNFYIEVPQLANLNETEVLDYRSDLGIKITGTNCPKPVQSWSQCGLPEKIHQLLKKYGYEKPTPIQAQTIPAIMSGRNIIGIARTGSGKTLAFLLPMFRHVLAQERPKQGEGMIGLIMSPTRELALQIYTECKKFSKILGLRACCVYGGANIGEQIADLKRGADIVVCTPGRMIDILCANNKRITNLKRVSFVVLDEADRMFDLGFGPQIMCVIDNVRPDRQTVMFSATFPFKVEQAARKILVKPLEIIAGGRSIVCADVEQIVEVRPSETRYRRLLELLAAWYHKGQILIFTNKQDSTDNLFGLLTRANYRCLSLHGSKDQTDRDETISDFKNKVKTILIATPLASRGLDVKDLNLVINYDCPDHLEDYVHRVGRTGRAGNKGTAYTFILPEECRFAPSIIKALEQSGTKVPEELAKLGQEYARLRKEGKEIVIANRGFGGRGHKFDAAEEDKKKEERKLQKKAYGIEDDEEEEEAEAAVDDTKSPTTPPVISPTNTTTNAAGGSTTTSAPPTAAVAAAASLLQGVDPNLPASQQAIKQILGGGVQLSSEAAIKAAQLAAQMAAAKPMASAKVVSSTHTTTFQEEIEINDYSQQARWKVTHKDALAQIIENTATAVTTKGTYFPPNKTPGPGEKKLYLLIEGPSEAGVKTAKIEIKKILDEVQSHSDKGKYSVF